SRQSEKLNVKKLAPTKSSGAKNPAVAASSGVTHHAAESRSPTPSRPRRDAPYARRSATSAVRPNGVGACVKKKPPATKAHHNDSAVSPARPIARGQSHTTI